jgi:hypothetical protein
VKHY